MALSFTQSTGDGTTRQFAVGFPYLAQSHVRVFVDGSEVSYTWLNPSLVQVATAPVDGAVVTVQRFTPRDTILVDFVDGSTLTETDLDTATLQTFFLAQEAFDASQATLGLLSDGSFSALNRRISNLAEPVGQTDAVTKGWAETAQGAQLAQAITARQGAETARTGSETARAASETARDVSVAARDTASGHSTAAQTARTGAETARTGAETARSGSEAARDTGLTHRNAAETFRNEAQTFRNEAQTFRNEAEAFSPGAINLGSLADVDTSGATAGDGLSFNGTSWEPGAAGGGMFKGNLGTTGSRAGDIFRVNAQTLDTNTTIAATENASAAGPLVIDTGVTLTIADGGSLVVL